jgi:hypothetical protein
MASTTKRADRDAQDQALIDGISAVYAQSATLTFGSLTMAPGDLVKMLQGRIATGKAVIDADAARATAVKADLDQRAKTGKTVSAFRRFVLAQFTNSPDTLAKFGLKVPKTGNQTVATKAKAKVKSAATRKLRNTVGPKARKKITVESTAAANTGTPAPAPVPSAKPTA